MRLAVDVGGTFIDFVCQNEDTGRVRTEKIRSSGELSIIVHGSTMAINSIVQENGARVGLITTAGFRE